MGPPRVLRGARPAELFSKALNCAACEDFHRPVIAHKAGSSQGGKSRVKTRSQGRCPKCHSAIRPTAPSQSASLWGWHSTSHLLALRRWSQEVQAVVGCGEGLGVCKSRAESCSLATPKRALSTRPQGLPPGPFAQPHGTHGWGGAGVSGRSRAGVCTRWPFAARRESSPLAGSEMIPSPPCFVIKSNPSGLDRDACYSRSLSSGAGISCRAWGDSPSLSHPLRPLLLLLFCVSPLLGGAGGGAGS